MATAQPAAPSLRTEAPAAPRAAIVPPMSPERRAEYLGYLQDGRVFDAEWYLDHYPDLRKNGVQTAAQARQHFMTYGLSEGRRGAPGFDPSYYRRNNPDVDMHARALEPSNPNAAALEHYVVFGASEGRAGSASAGNAHAPLGLAAKVAALEADFEGVIDFAPVDVGHLSDSDKNMLGRMDSARMKAELGRLYDSGVRFVPNTEDGRFAMGVSDLLRLSTVLRATEQSHESGRDVLPPGPITLHELLGAKAFDRDNSAFDGPGGVAERFTESPRPQFDDFAYGYTREGERVDLSADAYYDVDVLRARQAEDPDFRPEVVVWVHGGAWIAGDEETQFHSPANRALLAQLMADGKVVVSPDYRLIDGTDVVDAPVGDVTVHDGLADVQALLRQLDDAAHSEGTVQFAEDLALGLSPSMSAIGISAGAHLVLASAAMKSDHDGAPLLKSVVSVAGPAEIESEYHQIKANLFEGEDPPQDPALLAQILRGLQRPGTVEAPLPENIDPALSPVNMAADIDPSTQVMLVYSFSDQLVPVDQGQQMYDALVANGVPVVAEYRGTPNHAFAGQDSVFFD